MQILSVHSDPSALESFLGLSAATAGEVSKSCKSNGVDYFTGSSLVHLSAVGVTWHYMWDAEMFIDMKLIKVERSQGLFFHEDRIYFQACNSIMQAFIMMWISCCCCTNIN